jgi:8-oxo-dGTP pyrophosphatase MutT (NUDIX family)
MKIVRLIGAALYWLAWPLYKVYFRFGDRTRVVVVLDGKILAMQQWIGTGRWSLPGGGLHRNEDPLVGALRELHEETGLRMAPPQLEYLGIHQYRQNGQHFRFHVYACELTIPPELHRQWYEVAVLAWLNLSDFTAQTAADDALQSVRLVADRTRLLQ